MSAAMNTTVNAWMLHPLDCSCLKCTTWREQHGPSCCCGLKSCWERQVLLQEGEVDDLLA